MSLNQAQPYTPSKLEKLLGKNYKWWYFFRYSLVLAQAGIYATFIAQITNFVYFFITIYVWAVNNNSSEVITYLALGSVYRNLSQTFLSEKIGLDVINGKINNLLLTPQGYLQYHFYANLGQRVVKNISLVSTSCLVTLFFFGKYKI